MFDRVTEQAKDVVQKNAKFSVITEDAGAEDGSGAARNGQGLDAYLNRLTGAPASQDSARGWAPDTTIEDIGDDTPSSSKAPGAPYLNGLEPLDEEEVFFDALQTQPGSSPDDQRPGTSQAAIAADPSGYAYLSEKDVFHDARRTQRKVRFTLPRFEKAQTRFKRLPTLIREARFRAYNDPFLFLADPDKLKLEREYLAKLEKEYLGLAIARTFSVARWNYLTAKNTRAHLRVARRALDESGSVEEAQKYSLWLRLTLNRDKKKRNGTGWMAKEGAPLAFEPEEDGDHAWRQVAAGEYPDIPDRKPQFVHKLLDVQIALAEKAFAEAETKFTEAELAYIGRDLERRMETNVSQAMLAYERLFLTQQPRQSYSWNPSATMDDLMDDLMEKQAQWGRENTIIPEPKEADSGGIGGGRGGHYRKEWLSERAQKIAAKKAADTAAHKAAPGSPSAKDDSAGDENVAASPENRLSGSSNVVAAAGAGVVTYQALSQTVNMPQGVVEPLLDRAAGNNGGSRYRGGWLKKMTIGLLSAAAVTGGYFGIRKVSAWMNSGDVDNTGSDITPLASSATPTEAATVSTSAAPSFSASANSSLSSTTTEAGVPDIHDQMHGDQSAQIPSMHFIWRGRPASYWLDPGDTLTPGRFESGDATIRVYIESSESTGWLALRLTSGSWNFSTGDLAASTPGFSVVTYTDVGRDVRIELNGPSAVVQAIKKIVDADILEMRKERHFVANGDVTDFYLRAGDTLTPAQSLEMGLEFWADIDDSTRTGWPALNLTHGEWNFNAGQFQETSLLSVVTYTDIRKDISFKLHGECDVIQSIKQIVDKDIAERQEKLHEEKEQIKLALNRPILSSQARTFKDWFDRQTERWAADEQLGMTEMMEQIVETTISGTDKTFYQAIGESVGHPVTRFNLIEVLLPSALSTASSLGYVNVRLSSLDAGRFDMNGRTLILCKVALTNKRTGFQWNDEFSVTLGNALRGEVYSIESIGLSAGDVLHISYVFPDESGIDVEDREKYQAFKSSLAQERIVHADLGGKPGDLAFPSMIAAKTDASAFDRSQQDQADDEDTGNDSMDDDESDENESSEQVDPIEKAITDAGGRKDGLSMDGKTRLAYRIEFFDDADVRQWSKYFSATLRDALRGGIARTIHETLNGHAGYRVQVTYVVPGISSLHSGKAYRQFANNFFRSGIIAAELGGEVGKDAFPVQMVNENGVLRGYSGTMPYGESVNPVYPYWKRIGEVSAHINISNAVVRSNNASSILKGREKENYENDLAVELKKEAYYKEQSVQIEKRINKLNADGLAYITTSLGVRLQTAQLTKAKTLEQEIKDKLSASSKKIAALRKDVARSEEEWQRLQTRLEDSRQFLAGLEAQQDLLIRQDAYHFVEKYLPSEQQWKKVGQFSATRALFSDDQIVLKITSANQEILQPVLVPDEFRAAGNWSLAVANATNSLPGLAAGVVEEDWIVPTGDTNDFYVPASSGITKISVEEESGRAFGKSLVNWGSPVYNKPISGDEQWKEVGQIDATRFRTLAPNEERSIILKLYDGSSVHIKLKVPENFGAEANWPLYVANFINSMSDLAGGERLADGMIRPRVSVDANGLYALQASPIVGISVSMHDKRVSRFIARTLETANVVSDLDATSEVAIHFSESAGVSTENRLSLGECLRGGVHDLIKRFGIGDDGGTVTISYSWPWSNTANARNFEAIEETLKNSGVFGPDPAESTHLRSFPAEIRNKKIIGVVSGPPRSDDTTTRTLNTAQQCQAAIDDLVEFFESNGPRENEPILRSPSAYLAYAGNEIFRKNAMPHLFDPDEMVLVNYEIWSDNPMSYVTRIVLPHPVVHALFSLSPYVATPAVHAYGKVFISQGILISGNLKKEIGMNTFRISSGSDRLPNKVFQELIAADPSAPYLEETTRFYTDPEFRRISGEGYKDQIHQTIRKHIQSTENDDPVERLKSGDAQLYAVTFTDGKTTSRLGKTLMYSDAEKSIHFLIMPDWELSQTIADPNVPFVVRSGDNWRVLTEMLESADNESLVKSVLASFKDADFESEDFKRIYGTAYVQAIKAAREQRLGAQYVHEGSVSASRSEKAMIQDHLNKYYDDLLQRLNQAMDEMTTSQAELNAHTWAHAVKFVGELIATGLYMLGIGAGVGGAAGLATRFGVAGLTTAVASATGTWLTKKYVADNPAEADAALSAWLGNVVAEVLGFLTGELPMAKWVYKGIAGNTVTREIRARAVAKYIERTWGPSIGALGLTVGDDLTTYIQNAVARELMKRGMPDPRTNLDVCNINRG